MAGARVPRRPPLHRHRRQPLHLAPAVVAVRQRGHHLRQELRAAARHQIRSGAGARRSGRAVSWTLSAADLHPGGKLRGRPGMIVELGHFALILAFMVAIFQMIVPLIGAHKNWPGWMAVAEPAATTQFLLTAFSFAALTYAFVVSDFSLRLVVAELPHRQADALQDHRRLGEPRGLAAALGADPDAVRRLAAWFGQQPAADAQGARAGGAGDGGGGLLRLHALHLEPVHCAWPCRPSTGRT
jgi:hypothetical protein